MRLTSAGVLHAFHCLGIKKARNVQAERVALEHLAANRLKRRQRTDAQIEHPGLEWQVTAEIPKPADPRPVEVTLQWFGEDSGSAKTAGFSLSDSGVCAS